MQTRFHKILVAVLALGLALMACEIGSIKLPTGGSAATPPVKITGTFTYTNDIITTYYVEQEVALVDMYGFIKRDKEWKIPVPSQTLGFLTLDPEKKTGKYDLQLPAQPRFTCNIAVDFEHTSRGGVPGELLRLLVSALFKLLAQSLVQQNLLQRPPDLENVFRVHHDRRIPHYLRQR